MRLILALLLLVPAVGLADELNLYRVTVDTNTDAYTAADQVGTLRTITDAVEGYGEGQLVHVSVLDKGKQKSSLILLFFSAAPTVASANNAALDVTDAEMASKFLGLVAVTADDYVDITGSSVNTVDAITYGGKDLVLSSTTGDIYMLIQTLGTPTYTSTSDLVVTLGIKKGQ